MEAAERTYVSVRFSPAGRVQRFLLADGVEPPPAGAQVVVRTESGAALGRAEPTIPTTAGRRPPPDATSPLRVVRHASQADIVARLKHEQREREARHYAIERIRAHDLPMKLSRVEQPFDGSRLIFYFTADTRVDFRELVKELAGRFRTRIEIAADRRARRSQDAGRLRLVRPSAVLQHLADFVRAGVHPHGQAAGPVAEPVEALGPVRPTEVLPALRVAQQQGRARRRLWRRGELRQPDGLRHRRVRIRGVRELRALMLGYRLRAKATARARSPKPATIP